MTSSSPDAGVAEWADFVFTERNPAGLIREWWIHVATNFVFVVDRNTLTEEIIRTYRVNDPLLSHSIQPSGSK